jgi:hypothetical protein
MYAKKSAESQAWWCTCAIPEPRRLRQEELKFMTSLGYTIGEQVPLAPLAGFCAGYNLPNLV